MQYMQILLGDNQKTEVGCGSSFLQSQHLEGRGGRVTVCLRLTWVKEWVPGKTRLNSESLAWTSTGRMWFPACIMGTWGYWWIFSLYPPLWHQQLSVSHTECPLLSPVVLKTVLRSLVASCLWVTMLVCDMLWFLFWPVFQIFRCIYLCQSPFLVLCFVGITYSLRAILFDLLGLCYEFKQFLSC